MSEGELSKLLYSERFWNTCAYIHINQFCRQLFNDVRYCLFIVAVVDPCAAPKKRVIMVAYCSFFTRLIYKLLYVIRNISFIKMLTKLSISCK